MDPQWPRWAYISVSEKAFVEAVAINPALDTGEMIKAQPPIAQLLRQDGWRMRTKIGDKLIFERETS